MKSQLPITYHFFVLTTIYLAACSGGSSWGLRSGSGLAPADSSGIEISEPTGSSLVGEDGGADQGLPTPTPIPTATPSPEPTPTVTPPPSPTPIPSPKPPEDHACGEQSGFQLLGRYNNQEVKIRDFYVIDHLDRNKRTTAVIEDGDNDPENDVKFLTSEVIIRVNVTGLYQIFNVGYESGNTQWNETAAVQITNSMNPDGFPKPQSDPPIPNCDYDFMVKDNDNGGAGSIDNRVYFGTFDLVAGEDNLVTLHHYCPMFREGRWKSLHNDDPTIVNGKGKTSCDAKVLNKNSVHFKFSLLCVYRL